MRKKYFGYVRVSTKKQGKGASLGEQQAAIEAFARQNDLSIARWFRETMTAAKTGRREFSEMLRELKQGRADGVIIHRIDRSARNLDDWVALGKLFDAGVEVHFAHERIDLGSRGGRLAADIQAVVAADFIRGNREAVKICMNGWAARGYYPWPPPLGYLNGGRHGLKPIDPIRGPLVRKAFELYASGTFSLDTLRERLAREGLTTSSGAPIGRTRLAYVLRNPFYAGTIRLRRTGVVYEGQHTPLVSRKLFDRVQAVLDGRVVPKHQHHEASLRRLIQCANCPRTLTSERQKGHRYYRCHTKACRGVSFSEAALERDHIFPALHSLHFDEDEMADIRAIATDLMQTELQDENTRVAGIDRDLANVASKLERLTDAMLEGLVDQDAFNERKGRLLEQRARLSEARKDAASQPFWRGVLERFELGNMALLHYQSSEPAERRKTLISLGSNFTANGKELTFAMEFPFLQVMEWRSISDSAPFRSHVRTHRLSASQLRDLIQFVANAAPDCPRMRA